MNAPTNRWKTIWARMLAGGEISAQEERDLAAAIDEHPEVTTELLADARIHDLLSLQSRMEERHDGFVRGIMSQLVECDEIDCNESQNDSVRPESDWAPNTVDPQEEPSVDAVELKSNSPVFELPSNSQRTVDSAAAVQAVNIDLTDSNFRADTPTESRRLQLSNSNVPLLISSTLAALLLGFIIGQNSRTPKTSELSNAKPTNQRNQVDTGIQQKRPSATDLVKRRQQNLVDPNADARGFVEPALEVVAKLADSRGAIWRDAPVGGEIEKGTLILRQGTATLEFLNGTTVEVTGPSEFDLISSNEIALIEGDLAAAVPPNAIGFLVSTPNARVIDLGTEFGVTVNERQETNVLVRDGDVMVVPVRDGTKSGQRWHLTAGELNQAKVFGLPGLPGRRPIAAQVMGDGRFLGAISVDGETLRFDSPKSFDEMCSQVAKRFDAAPNQAVQDFEQIVKLNQGAGAIDLNGVQINLGNLNEIMQLSEELRNKAAELIPKNNGLTDFQGSMMINGKKQTFKTKEEFEQLRKQMFAPLQQFGINPFNQGANAQQLMDAFQKLQQQATLKSQQKNSKVLPGDKQNNPFLPK